MSSVISKHLGSNALESNVFKGSRLGCQIFGEHTINRSSVERYIANKFLCVHDAHLSGYLPILIQFFDELRPQAAIGLKPGIKRPFFLEQYLDKTLEQQASVFLNCPIDRCRVMEVGNLVITAYGFAKTIMVILIMALNEIGYQHICFTATKQLQRIINQMGFNTIYLVKATKNKLQKDENLWGSYYENDPAVMLACICLAVKAIHSRSDLEDIYQKNRSLINFIAYSIRKHTVVC